MTDLTHLCRPGAEIALRVTPRASRDAIAVGDDGSLRAHVTAPPADGRANEALRRMLAEALGIAKTRLTLVRGAKSRDKAFRID